MDIAILLLAAGSSSRMRGRDKLLERVAGAPLVATMARRALAVTPHVLVMVPEDGHPRARAISALPVRIIPVPEAAEGMGASIRTGIATLPEQIEGIMVLPADMPDLTQADLATVAAAWQSAPDTIHRATAQDGTPGHPVLFPARLRPALGRLAGDTGARPVLQAEEVRPVTLPAHHALTDLDTPEDWDAWRARS